MTPSRNHASLIERHDAEVEAAIERSGFHATHVLGDQVNTPFSYTTGFLLAGHPELVILGLAPVHCQDLFEHVMDQVRQGATLPVGRDAPNTAGEVPFRLLPVPSEHWAGGDCLLLGFASFYGPRQLRFRGEPFLQLIHPDRNLRFPWTKERWTSSCAISRCSPTGTHRHVERRCRIPSTTDPSARCAPANRATEPSAAPRGATADEAGGWAPLGRSRASGNTPTRSGSANETARPHGVDARVRMSRRAASPPPNEASTHVQTTNERDDAVDRGPTDVSYVAVRRPFPKPNDVPDYELQLYQTLPIGVSAMRGAATVLPDAIIGILVVDNAMEYTIHRWLLGKVEQFGWDVAWHDSLEAAQLDVAARIEAERG